MKLPAVAVLPRGPSDSDGSSERRGKPIGSQSSSWNTQRHVFKSPGVSSGTTDKLHSDLQLGGSAMEIDGGRASLALGSHHVAHNRHESDLRDILEKENFAGGS